MLKWLTYPECSLRVFENTPHAIDAFALCCILQLAVFYGLGYWEGSMHQQDVTSFGVGCLMCISLWLHHFLVDNTDGFYRFYFYGVMILCVPCLSTFHIFMHAYATPWLLNGAISVCFLMIFVSAARFIWIQAWGMGLAYSGYVLCTGESSLHMSSVSLPIDGYGLGFRFVWLLIMGLFFSRLRERHQKHILKVALRSSALTAHELQTPLATLEMRAHAAQKIVSNILNAPTSNQVESIKRLQFFLEKISKETTSTQVIADMMLTINRSRIPKEIGKTCAINDCILEAVRRYPFKSDTKKVVNLDLSDDFLFKGQHDLVIHVILNLLQNALIQIRSVGYGKIYIWSEKNQYENFLHFKDTACGIAKQDLAHLFEDNFTTTHNGQGLGLFFCKTTMLSLEGDIHCMSKVGHFTHFVLRFPRMQTKAMERYRVNPHQVYGHV